MSATENPAKDPSVLRRLHCAMMIKAEWVKVRALILEEEPDAAREPIQREEGVREP